MGWDDKLPMGSLPRVASIASSIPQRHLQPSGSSRFKADSQMDSMSSVLFPDASEPTHGKQHGRASAFEISKTSMDHPLNIPDMAPARERSQLPSQREPPQMHNLAAGRRSVGSMPARAVLTGDDTTPMGLPAPPSQKRHEYQPPTYQIRRSGVSEVRDLLYGGQQPSNQSTRTTQGQGQHPPTAPPEHPLAEIYMWLRNGIGSAPRDREGHTDENVLSAALAHVGLSLATDGFAELLARCDVSDVGFPAFDEFVGCVGRPHRPPPEEATLAAAPAREAEPKKSPEVEAVQDQRVTAPEQSEPGGQGHQTWRHMQVSDDMENRRPSSTKPATQGVGMSGTGMTGMTGTARLGVAPKKPVSSFPLGAKSHVPTLGSNVASMYSKSHHGQSHKFSESFDPDHYY